MLQCHLNQYIVTYLLWYCCLGHLTRNIVHKIIYHEMIYIVSSATLNPSIPHRTILWGFKASQIGELRLKVGVRLTGCLAFCFGALLMACIDAEHI